MTLIRAQNLYSLAEVAVRGPNVMLGYWNKPEQTAAVLRGGWMHTGDGGRMDEDGYLFIVDRMKDMIVSGGENVYSAEVENALSLHLCVAASAVIGIPSDEWGEAVHAVVVLKPGTSATAEELSAHCHGLIAGYKCPRSTEFRDALPMTGTGKIQKTELRKPYWVGRPYPRPELSSHASCRPGQTWAGLFIVPQRIEPESASASTALSSTPVFRHADRIPRGPVRVASRR